MANNKGNQTIPDNTGKTYNRTVQTDIRPSVFKAHYTNPSSETFMNIYQSAMRAGYSQTYASNISVQKPKWFMEMIDDNDVRRARMLYSAEKAIERAIDYDDNDKDKANLKLKAATFVSERLGKGHYSTRQEVTGADGRSVFANEERERTKTPLATLFKGVKAADQA